MTLIKLKQNYKITFYKSKEMKFYIFYLANLSYPKISACPILRILKLHNKITILKKVNDSLKL